MLWRDCMIDTSSGLLSLPSQNDDIVTDMFQIRAFDNGAEIGIQTVIRIPNRNDMTARWPTGDALGEIHLDRDRAGKGVSDR